MLAGMAQSQKLVFFHLVKVTFVFKASLVKWMTLAKKLPTTGKPPRSLKIIEIIATKMAKPRVAPIVHPRPPKKPFKNILGCSFFLDCLIILVGETGFEPVTFRMSSERANQLRHSPDYRNFITISLIL